MPKIVQEFYCRGCEGYIIVPLSQDFNRRVLVVCPKCGRKHQREVRQGVLYDVNKFSDESKIEEVYVPQSAWNKNPCSHLQEEASKKFGSWHNFRGGAVIETPRDLIEEAWFDRYGNRT